LDLDQNITAATTSFPDTMAECDVLIFEIFPEKNSFPTVSAMDYLKQTAADMIYHLKSTNPNHLRLYTLAHQFLNSFGEVTGILCH